MLQLLRTREAKGQERARGQRHLNLANTHLDSLLALAKLLFELRGLGRELLVGPDKRLRDAQRQCKSAREGELIADDLSRDHRMPRNRRRTCLP
jgi:hypothetical protein